MKVKVIMLRKLWRLGLAVVLLPSFCSAVTGAIHVYPSPAETAMTLESADSSGIVLGAYVPPVYPYAQEIEAFNQTVGHTHPIVMYFATLTVGLSDDVLDQIHAMDPTPVPYASLRPSASEGLQDIANGDYDTQLKADAAAVRRFGERIMIDFAPQFNFSHSPYYGDPQVYVAAWRHVHDLFAQEGASNVEWVWSLRYASDSPRDPVSDYNLYYPGDDYVDWIGIVGHNWGDSNPSALGWVSFDDLFHDILMDTACRYRKPQLVGFLGSVNGPGSKVDWIKDAYQSMQQYPNLRAVVWFNDCAFGDPQYDFRITYTSLYGYTPGPYPPYTDAYKEAISDSVFLTTMPPYDQIRPPSAVCFDLQALSDRLLLGVGESTTTRIALERAPGFTQTVALSAEASPEFTHTIDPISLEFPTTTANLELHASQTVTLGIHPLKVRGEADGLIQTIDLDVLVADPIFHTYFPLVAQRYGPPGIALGAHIPPVNNYWEEIQAFNQIVGRTHPIIMYYGDLTSAFTDYLLNQFRYKLDPTPIPLITMDPPASVTLWDIANGVYDSDLRQNADVAKRFGEPMMVIFAHEFNGSYTPYYGDPEAYIAAWRHIHDLFAQEGVTNVQWVWSPNYKSDRPDDPVSDYNLYYPGDDYVDWIGVSGFNWGEARPYAWVDFNYLFHDFLVDTASRYHKPQIISIFGCADGSGSKVEWIEDAYQAMQQHPNLRAVVWFNDFAYGDQNDADFRVTITSKYGATPGPYSPYTEAYIEAISASIFRTEMPSYNHTISSLGN